MTEPLSTVLTHEHHEIDVLLEAVADADGSDASLPQQLSASADTLRRHIWIEEEYLFPPLQEAGIVMPVLVMLREHGEIWRLLDELQDAMATNPGEVAESCRALLQILSVHNTKEEPILYPEMDARVVEEVQREVLATLDGGQMPEGWVCAKAALN